MAELDKPRIQELERFSMFAKSPSGVEAQSPRLAWCIREGYPRLTAYTNIPGDTQNSGAISGSMSAEYFFMFLDSLEKVALNPAESKFCFKCYSNFDPITNTRTNERTLLASIMYGRDENGIIWISVVADNRPKIQFPFTAGARDLTEILTASGEPMTEQEFSSLRVLSQVKALRSIYSSFMNTFRQPKNAGAPANRPAAPKYESELSFI